MGFLALLIGAAAAFRLQSTPLAAAAAICAGLQGAAWIALIVTSRGERPAPRLLTALHHVCAALSGFFLFVSFAMGPVQ
ncbi:MAG TPA: hypothetical protein VEC57_16845 [Candidatus Limnocylindrales bacterium]|nr:hypothetical protein [Candidatus Limnocylindrales bacterium]